MKHLYITLLVCFSSTFAIGQESKFEQLGQFLDSLAAKNKFMGVLLIADQGKPVFQKAVGWADVSVGKPMEVNSKLRVGSVTKMMTTVLIFKAIEAKKLSLDQKLADFYPQIKNADKVSISHLLQHRSGIFNFTNRLDYNIFRSNPHTEEQLLAMMIEGGSIFEPDSKADYSNSNFVLLTFILEKVYGMPYQKLLQDQILTPLGMKDTSVFGKIAVEKGETKSYLYNGKWVEDQEAHYTVPLGAGAISSTVSDLNVFISALFEGKLISKESLESMKDLRDGYGRGLFSFPYYERKSFGHTG
ncbi:MAG: beta-lactamase family protein, partial [Algoriphagus sp.]|nr:beta-lactamase family protein [Algoriphagus sp.]